METKNVKKSPAEKSREIHYAIGLAIVQWQNVEMALTNLFGLLVNAKAIQAASAAFVSVINFNAKLAMIDHAAAVTLKDSPLFDECHKLLGRLGKKVKKRNELAHFMLYQKAIVYQEGEPIPDISAIDFYLQPSSFDGAFQYRHDNNPKRLVTADIMMYAQTFITLHKEVMDFSMKVKTLVMPQESTP